MSKENLKTILSPGEEIRDTFTVERLIGVGGFSEVYRARHKFLGLQALKVYKEGSIEDQNKQKFFSEALILSHITHPNVVRVFEANSFKKNEKIFHYISMEYIAGETLLKLLKRKGRTSLQFALSIMRDICAGLSVAHNQKPPVVHSDVKLENILISYDSPIPTAKISDFGVAKVIDSSIRNKATSGTIIYMAPENFWNIYTPASDVFSAGIVLYQMLTGRHPWIYSFREADDKFEKLETIVLKTQKIKPKPPSYYNEKVDQFLDNIVMKAIEYDISKRYKNAEEFLTDLIEYENKAKTPINFVESRDKINKYNEKDKGGFAAIAGMNELKEIFYKEIILPLEQRELYNKYRISLPNGILLYGPPGCGKTYLAQRLAEEIKHTFIEVRPSDLASVYIHGTQEKIGELFRKAREQAPAIIFIDEIDAILPRREQSLSHHYSAEVNEFLSQVSDCSKDGIIIIATTNRPDKIDPAALRSGRIDKLIYVPPPDKEARCELFKFFLSQRPIENNLDYDYLAMLTESYIVSDIELIVNQAARQALEERSDIKMQHLITQIKLVKPSISQGLLRFYEKFREKRSFD